MHNDQRVTDIAHAFVDLLRHQLSDDEWRTMLRRNANHAAQGLSGVCASHDFLDANMLMADACTRHGVDPASDDATWNAAWRAAMPQLTAAREDDVVSCLQAVGLSVTYEYPGFVCITTPTGWWDIGTANVEWGGNFIEGPTGECSGNFELAGTAAETSAATVAKRIVIALAEYIR